MASDSNLRDPRVEPLEPEPPSSNAYLHRAARVAVLLAIPALTHAAELPKLRGPAGAGARVERSVARRAAPRAQLGPASLHTEHDADRGRR